MRSPIKISPKLVVLLVFILLFALVFFLGKNKKHQVYKEKKIAVRVQKPIFGTLDKTLRLNGYVRSDEMVTITPKVPGQIDQIFFDVGQKVKVGQIIAEIDSEPMLLTLKQAESAYLASKSSYERISKLYKANATTKQNYDQTKGQYDAYKSQYELAKLQYNYSKIKSPISGVVLIRHTSVGSMVDTRTPIATIANLKKLIVRSQIPSKYYFTFNKHQKDMKIIVTQPDSQINYPVEIRTIAPYISADTKSFEVVCTFKNPDNNLKPGMFIYIDFILESRKNVYYLPFKTLVSTKQAWFLDSNNKARSTNLTVSYYNDNYFEVSPSFKNTLFIVEGQFFLQEGQEVNILNKENHQ